MTLLVYAGKYVLTSTNSVTNSTTTLADDTEVSQTFSLSSTQIVLAIYSANCAKGDTMPAKGMQTAISVDASDKANSYDSGFGANYPVRNCTFWIGSLAAGSHTIKGRFASMTASSTATITNRALLIYIFDGTEFQYVDDGTTRTTTSNTLTADLSSPVTFTPSGTCVLLALYNASASGATEDMGGKQVALSIGGSNYGQAEKTPEATDYPDSVFTAHCLTRTAVSTTVQGMFANLRAGSVTVSIHRRQLGVLLIDNSVPFDIVTSTTLVDTTSNSLVDDAQASISRTPAVLSELLVIAMATKRYNQPGPTSGMRYGIKVDTNDRTTSRGSMLSGGSSWGDSCATAWAEQVTAVAHTVKGRMSNNYASEDSYVSARQVVALWFAAVATNINVSDSGSGSDVGSLSVALSVSDANSATSEGASTSSTLTIAESGNGSESWTDTVSFTVADAGAGSEVAAQAVSITFTDSGSGADAVSPSVAILISETPTGTDLVALTISLVIVDWGAGVDVSSPEVHIPVFEETLGAEFAWRLKGSALVDSFQLPHVLSIAISDDADMSTRLVQGGTKPKQRMLGKPGRTVTITGWTDTQSDIDSMDALADGTTRTFIHPSGDSFAVLVTGFQPESKVDEYGRRNYTLTLKETR